MSRALVCRVKGYSPARYEYVIRLLGFGSGAGLRLDRERPEFHVARSLTLYLREGMLGRRLCCWDLVSDIIRTVTYSIQHVP